MLTATQKGAAGEQLRAASVTLSSDGDLELFKPITDDDHTSADFNRMTYRGKGPNGRGIELQFMARPARPDKWTRFRLTRLKTGPRLLSIIDALPSVKVPRVAGAHLLLRRK